MKATNKGGKVVEDILKERDVFSIPNSSLPCNNIVLDYIYGFNGIPLGKCIGVTSEPGVGKTHIALAHAKAICDSGYKVIYLDFEHGLEKTLINSFNLEKYYNNLFYVPFVETYDDLVDVCYNILKDDTYKLIIIDSEASILPSTSFIKSKEDILRPRIGCQSEDFKNFIKFFKPKFSLLKKTFLFVQQHRANININSYWRNNQGIKWAGGYPFNHNMDVFFDLSVVKRYYDKSNMTIYVDVYVKEQKNKLGNLKKVVIPIDYGYGLSVIRFIYNYCEALKLIQRQGRGYLIEKNNEKIGSFIELIRYLHKNEEVLEYLVSEVLKNYDKRTLIYGEIDEEGE